MTTRRDFIKKTTVGSAAITLGTFALPGTLNAGVLGANDQLQVAVIGVRSRAKALTMGISKSPNVKITSATTATTHCVESRRKRGGAGSMTAV